MSSISNELSLCAAQRAADLVSSWDEFPLNESKISDRFSSRMEEYICGSFPRTQNAFMAEVLNWTGGLFFLEMNTLDVVPSTEATPKVLEIEGNSLDYDELPPPSSEVRGQAVSSPYFLAIGNCTVRVSCGSVVLHKESCFERPVISALPLIESKLRSFESASSGEFSDLGNLVSYMLNTLAELRTLQGFGNPMYSGADAADILTEEDVYRAVAVGLLIEQARLFRTVDSSFAAEVEQLCGVGSPGLPFILSPRSRVADPAELFLWFLGIVRVELDPELLVSFDQRALSLFGPGALLFPVARPLGASG